MSIISPCIDRCDTNGVNCTSCGRTHDEVQEWFYADDERKQQIMSVCVTRLDPAARDYWEEQYEYKVQDTQ